MLLPTCPPQGCLQRGPAGTERLGKPRVVAGNPQPDASRRFGEPDPNPFSRLAVDLQVDLAIGANCSGPGLDRVSGGPPRLGARRGSGSLFAASIHAPGRIGHGRRREIKVRPRTRLLCRIFRLLPEMSARSLLHRPRIRPPGGFSAGIAVREPLGPLVSRLLRGQVHGLRAAATGARASVSIPDSGARLDLPCALDPLPCRAGRQDPWRLRRRLSRARPLRADIHA